MNWHFFERRVCLSTLAEEWEIGKREFERVGLEVERFQSIPDIGPHQSFNRSEHEILRQFLESGKDTLLHLEDDCVFRDLSLLPLALAELPPDWDILYLGANLVCWNNGEPNPERYSEHLFRVKAAWTTHAIAYRSKCVGGIITGQPGFSEIMFDNWLSGQLEHLQAFVVAPMVAYQRPRKSSIWDKPEVDDYTPIFEASEERLK